MYNEAIDGKGSREPKFGTGTDVRAQSSAIGSETYMILATDHLDKFEEITRRYNIGHKRVVGVYKGERENAYIVNAHYFATLAPALEGQESVLILGPCGRRGIRPATLHYLDWRQVPVSFGYFVDTPRDAIDEGRDYTFDPTTDKYYTCVHNVPELRAGSFASDFTNATEVNLGSREPAGEWTVSYLVNDTRLTSSRRFSNKMEALHYVRTIIKARLPRVEQLFNDRDEPNDKAN